MRFGLVHDKYETRIADNKTLKKTILKCHKNI